MQIKSTRLEIAAQIMAALIHHNPHWRPTEVAAQAMANADALIAEHERTKPQTKQAVQQ